MSEVDRGKQVVDELFAYAREMKRQLGVDGKPIPCQIIITPYDLVAVANSEYAQDTRVFNGIDHTLLGLPYIVHPSRTFLRIL